MKIAVLKETAEGEHRVAIHPDLIKKYIDLGFSIAIESGAGVLSDITDEEFTKAGALVSKIPLEIVSDADILLKVQPSDFENKKNNKIPDETKLLKNGALIIGFLSPHQNLDLIKKYKNLQVSAIAMELIPRITRAQTMDSLSSQSNLSGYRAVIDAVYEFSKAIPMMMTAAGSIQPAKILILGAGVAGLQAIATAKRLGAIVSAFDVRAAAREQVESLGASFVEVASSEDGSASGGYAKEMSAEYKQKQSNLIHQTLKTQDIVISTALIPGKIAPILITKEMIDDMKQGSIIVDLASIAGGNCELTKKDEITIYNGVKIIGHTNFASRIASSASKLYATNLYNLVSLIVKDNKDKLTLNFADEIIKSSVLTHDGKLVHEMYIKEE